MKPTTITLYGALLALALGMPTGAAGDTATAKPPRPTLREAKRVPPDTESSIAKPGNPGELTGQVVYQVLLAEVALQRGKTELASQAYADLALRTRDAAVIARAVEVASYARRFDLVLDLARLWLQVDPDSKRAQQVLAGVLILTNQFDGLAPELIRMLDADKASLPANLLGLNRMFVRSPDRQAVLQLVRQVCAPYPGIAEAHYALAVAAQSANERDLALSETRKALELRPDWELATLLEAQILAGKSNAEAIASLQDFLKRYPQSREVQLHLARALVGEKRYAEAKRQFEQLLQTHPNNPDVVYPVAILALQENDRPLAEAQLKHLLTLDVADKNAPYFYLGQLTDEDKRVDEAIDYYRKVGPGEHFLPAQMRAANILAKQGHLDAARAGLRAAAERNPPQRLQLLIGEAALLRDAKQTEAAFRLLDDALRQEPDQPDLLYESALLAERLDRLAIMEGRLRKLIELQPDSAQAYNALGYSYADRKLRLTEARQLIEKALQLTPNDPFILDSMGWVLYRQGDLEGALSYVRRAYEQRADPEIAAHLGEVLWMLGRKDEASAVLREAQKKDPAHEVLVEAVKKFSP